MRLINFIILIYCYANLGNYVIHSDEKEFYEVKTVNRRQKWIVFMIFLIGFTFPAQSYAAGHIIVESPTLNVRDGQGTHFEKLGTIYKDETYEILQESDDWIEIKWNDQTGWVSKEYIRILSEGTETTAEYSEDEHDSSIASFKTEIDHMYIRSEPSSSSQVVAYLDKGTSCTITEQSSNEWYSVTCDGEQGYMLKQHVASAPVIENESMRGKTIVIDAGHGGRDVGAIGVGGVYEKDLALKTALALEETLQALGAQVYMTRDDDSYVLLESRSLYANAVHADAFISIHYNSFPEVPSVTGIGTYYYEGLDQSLADAIQQSVALHSESPDRGIEYADFQVLRLNVRPGALVELGFISNAASEDMLQTDAYQRKLVHGIVNGLSTFFAENQ